MRLLRYCLLAACLTTVVGPARAWTPQTITVDGVNDFLPDNLLDDDRNDTQQFCSPPALPVDLGRVYVTNDNNYLYIGIEFARTCFCDMNLGFNIDVTTPAGGSADPFGRRIGWANLTNKPDFSLYDVTPTSCNSFNYEVLYKWNTGTSAWDNISTQVNPSWGSGSDGLGIVDSLTFKELRLPLSVLGLSAGNVINLEFWVTQEGTTKGPLDALASDAVQTSTPSSTVFDPPATVQMTSQFPYTVQNATDNVPPTVSSAAAVDFPLNPNRQFSTSTNKIDIVFNEPVDLTTAQTAGNYTYSGPNVRTVSSAVRDASALNVVHLTLNLPITANAAAFNVTANGVNDVAGNTIVSNGVTNKGTFYIQNVVFNADMALPLCNGAFAVSDTFAVEGSVPPLSFALCDNALMTDANADSVYTTTVPFCLPLPAGQDTARVSLEWKLTAKCSIYENFAGNRMVTLQAPSASGATRTLDVAWSNETPGDFLNSPIDVVFRVDASAKSPLPTDVITLLGNQAPLSFTQPGLAMLDNGVFPDAVAGDAIYSVRVRFNKCSNRFVNWKADFNGVIECLGQGDRSLALNEALNDTVGGPLGPLTLPARRFDRCTVTDKAVTVVLSVDMFPAGGTPPAPADTIAVNGSALPLTFDWPPVAAGVMVDDGAGDDARAGDYIFTRTVTFPDSTPLNVDYKFLRNGTYECNAFPNRSVFLNDVLFSTTNRLVMPLARWDFCSALDVPSVGPGPVRPGTAADFATLLQSFPNPGMARSTIRFELKRAGRVTLNVYDVTGRRVTTLLDASLTPGGHEVTWNGLDGAGHRVKAGIYLYELALGGERLTRRLVMSR